MISLVLLAQAGSWQFLLARALPPSLVHVCVGFRCFGPPVGLIAPLRSEIAALLSLPAPFSEWQTQVRTTIKPRVRCVIPFTNWLCFYEVSRRGSSVAHPTAAATAASVAVVRREHLRRGVRMPCTIGPRPAWCCLSARSDVPGGPWRQCCRSSASWSPCSRYLPMSSKLSPWARSVAVCIPPAVGVLCVAFACRSRSQLRSALVEATRHCTCMQLPVTCPNAFVSMKSTVLLSLSAVHY